MIINKKKFNWFWYKKITGHREDFATECLLEFDCIKNHYTLVAIDLSRQKKLDSEPKVIQQIEFVGQLKNLHDYCNAADAGNGQYTLTLVILEKKKEMILKFSQGSVTVL